MYFIMYHIIIDIYAIYILTVIIIVLNILKYILIHVILVGRYRYATLHLKALIAHFYRNSFCYTAAGHCKKKFRLNAYLVQYQQR